MLRLVLTLTLALSATLASSEGLTPDRLGVVFEQGNAVSERVARYYAAERGVPAENLVGLSLPNAAVISRGELKSLRAELLDKLPTHVQSLLLVWSRPYAVECMSITTAVAAGYQAAFCEPGCGRTKISPLYDTQGWLPADTVGWLPAMMLPINDESLARELIQRGLRADGSRPPGIVYLVSTHDSARNVRAAGYPAARYMVRGRVQVREPATPVNFALPEAIAYFTGAERVVELAKISFRPGAAADHLTSTGGALESSRQMSAIAWLRQGATASYGTVSEPCNHVGKFPSPSVFLDHYLRGDTLLEAYWKSVSMPGQGLFIGEPLARPFADLRSPWAP
jgi:uncharacterized protein (TIGR03790 family)